MLFHINITSYISSLSKNVFNTKLINQFTIASITRLNISYPFLVYPASSKIYLMEWITCIVVSLFFLPLAIFIFGSGLFLIFRIVSDLSSQEAEELERQKRKAEVEPLVQYLKEYYPLVYRAIFPD